MKHLVIEKGRYFGVSLCGGLGVTESVPRGDVDCPKCRSLFPYYDVFEAACEAVRESGLAMDLSRSLSSADAFLKASDHMGAALNTLTERTQYEGTGG